MSSTKQIIAYWRDSLKDAELTSLKLTEGNHVRVSFDAIEQGQLSQQATAALFSSNDQKHHPVSGGEDDISSMPVVVVPIVASKGGRSRNAVLCPLFIPAELSEDGRLRPENGVQRPWIPRPLLEPTSSDLVLGSVDALDDFWKSNLVITPDEDSPELWSEALDLGWRALRHVTNEHGQTILKEAGYKLDNQAAIINTSNMWGMSANILGVYYYLLEKKKSPPLLQELVRLSPKPPQPPLPINKWLAPAKLHLGSFNNQFPLSPSQRESLYHLFALPKNSILAVSGPPGTGKTTLLHSVIASLWVKAALLQKPPPVIVAASTNNQAVTNVIDSLSGIDDIERWLPAPSFGLYLVNTSDKQSKAESRGILTVNKYGDGFPNQAENPRFVSQAIKQYLTACSRYFERKIETVDEAVTALHESLNNVHSHSSILDTAFQMAELAEELDTIQTQHGSLQAYESIYQKQYVAAKEQLETRRALHTTWLQHIQDEPNSYSLLSFVPGIKRKRESGYQIFLNKHMPTAAIKPSRKTISQAINEQIKTAKTAVSTAKQQLEDAQKFIELHTTTSAKWENWRSRFAPELEWDQLFLLEKEDGTANKANLFNWLDTTWRYQLFLLATHYWEGRWLQEIMRDEITAPNFKESRNQPTQEKKWRRYAMLTPCFVTTMHTGPSFFDYYDGKSNPLLNYIDLLIVDEAGQVTPEVAGAMFALAKQALIVGDVQQIEPVWSILKQVDYGNLTRHNLIQNEADFSRLEARGITASSGSIMQLAQQASPYQILPKGGTVYERGMFLAEHRRCVPEIIGYCNELAYNGRLRPMRPSIKEHPWPHLGYVHVKGQATTEQGSRKNGREAQTIADWIAKNKNAFENHYQTEIENIIGIITPFSAQKRTLLQALQQRQITLSKVGTVHALQGGERPIILFSSVYTTKDANSYFFDRGPNMLNVAVSRAKDSFIVFGDMEIFDPQLNTPSGILARYLFADEANEMAGVPVPSRIEIKNNTDFHHIRSLNKHVRTLKRAFEHAEKRLMIVSPFLRWRAVEADDICGQTRAAVNRGVQVDIYVDQEFNDNLNLPAAAQAATALKASGATLHVCHNIHSKIICVDNDVFIEGSFNWLSSERNMKNYTRYETSMIHTGPMAAEFIEEVLADIQQRVIKNPLTTKE